MDNHTRIWNIGWLLLVVALSAVTQQAEAQTDRVDFFQTWQRRTNDEVLSELRDTQADARRAYRDYVRAMRDVHKERMEFARDNPGQFPHIISLRCVFSAWRDYQDELAKAQLLTLILRRRQAGLPSINFQPNQNFNNFAGGMQPNFLAGMMQPKFLLPAMNQQWKAFAKTPLAGMMSLTFFDANRDGKISRREAVGTPLAARFKKLDTNRDGFLKPAEITP